MIKVGEKWQGNSSSLRWPSSPRHAGKRRWDWITDISVLSLAGYGLLSLVWLFVTLWMLARQAPLSMGFFRQEDWSGLPFPPPGNLNSNPKTDVWDLSSRSTIRKRYASQCCYLLYQGTDWCPLSRSVLGMSWLGHEAPRARLWPQSPLSAGCSSCCHFHHTNHCCCSRTTKDCTLYEQEARLTGTEVGRTGLGIRGQQVPTVTYRTDKPQGPTG